MTDCSCEVQPAVRTLSITSEGLRFAAALALAGRPQKSGLEAAYPSQWHANDEIAFATLQFRVSVQ
jgi:hypothetical protein